MAAAAEAGTLPTMSRELTKRLTLGPLLALATVGIFVLDGRLGQPWGLTGLVVLAVGAGAAEFLALARRAAPLMPPLLVSTVALALLLVPVVPSLATLGAGAIVGLGLVAVTFSHVARHGGQDFVATIGATCFAWIYLGMLPGCILALAQVASPAFPQLGLALALTTLGAVKCGDVAAFFVGRAVGRHHMAPRLSPGKTWEGFIASLGGSIAGAVALAAVTAALYGHWPFPGWWQAPLFGLAIGPIGVLGDLVESAIKRDLGNKDSGTALPGFGGVLDVLDAIILAAPVAYLLGPLLSRT